MRCQTWVESELAVREVDLEGAYSEFKDCNETIEGLKAALAEAQTKLMYSETRRAVAEDHLAKAKEENSAEREKAQEVIRKALQEASFHRGKYEALTSTEAAVNADPGGIEPGGAELKPSPTPPKKAAKAKK